MKRITAFFLALFLLLSGIFSLAEDEMFFDDDEAELEDMTTEEVSNARNSLNALAGYNLDIPEDGDYKFQPLEDGKNCQILRYTGYDEDVKVPEQLKGLTVKTLYQTFSDSNILETVVLPDTLEIIDNMAFWKCINLKSVEIPEGVTTLGRCSFGGCSTLEKIEFPETLETVDDMVFIGCSGLTELKFGKNLKTIGSQAFTACVKLQKVSVPRGTVIAEDAFDQCPGLSDIEYYDAE